MSNHHRFAGKVAFITGAASGIGRATAMAFAAEGARVAILDRTEDALSETADAVRKAGAEALVIACDVSQPDQVEAAVGRVVDTFGQLDIAFNNAGVENKPAPSISPTDPQAALTCKHGPARYAYAINPLLDLDTDCILDVEATPARFAAEVAATRTLVSRAGTRLGIEPASLSADKAYGSGRLLGWLIDRNITPYIRQRDAFFTRDAFRYDREADAYCCPADKLLSYCGTNRTKQVRVYRSRPADCAACDLKPQCTIGPKRGVTRLVSEEARDTVRALAGTDAYVHARRRRQRIERVFGHLKRNLGLRTLKLRGLSGAAEEFTMAAAAYNLQLLARQAAPA